MAQWLRLHTLNAGGPGLIPGHGTRSHMLQLNVLHASTKTWCSQINKYWKRNSESPYHFSGSEKNSSFSIWLYLCHFSLLWFSHLKAAGFSDTLCPLHLHAHLRDHDSLYHYFQDHWARYLVHRLPHCQFCQRFCHSRKAQLEVGHLIHCSQNSQLLSTLLLFSCSLMSNSFATPWTVARQASLSMRFPRQEYWSGLPFPPPRDLPDPGIKAEFPVLAGRFFTT